MFLKKIVLNIIKEKSICLLFVLLIFSLLFINTSNYVFNNVFWNIYIAASGEPLISFIILPFFLFIGSKVLYYINNNETLIRLKNKRNSYIISIKISIYVFSIYYLLLWIFFLLKGLITSNGNFESIIVPGIKVSDKIGIVLNFFRIFVMILTLQHLQIILFNLIENKNKILIIVIGIITVIGGSVFISFDNIIGRCLPSAYMYDNHLFKGIIDCIISSTIYYLIHNLIIYYTYRFNYKKNNN